MKGEYIFLELFDVGRKIFLDRINTVLPGTRYKGKRKTKDTPSTIDIPEPFIIDITSSTEIDTKEINDLRIHAKIYEEGVISLSTRISFEISSHTELHKIHRNTVKIEDQEIKLNKLNYFHFNRIYKMIEEFIDKGLYSIDPPENEKYVCICITDSIGNPSEFIDTNQNYFATLLNGENPTVNLHSDQITKKLSRRSSYLKKDLIILDLDRCLIIDPNREYEDLLLIIEHANYQLLELRTLDLLLDQRLNIVELDVSETFAKRRLLTRKLKKKLGRLYRLRLDMIFTLENIENVSKIIGDYYLAEIFTKLNQLFELEKWSDSVHKRIRILSDIYNTAIGSTNERIVLYVEILLTIIFTLEFILVILDFFK